MYAASSLPAKCYRIGSRLIGILLCAAALLKLQGFATDPVAGAGFLNAPSVRFGSIEFEIVLGLWLLWGAASAAAWCVALLTFVVFAGISFYSGWIGQTSCGCLGLVAVDPWYVFGADMTIIVFLLFARPDLKSLREKPFATLKLMAGLTSGVMALLGVLVGVANAGFGSTDEALAFLRGESISARPIYLDVGTDEEGKTVVSSIEMVNRTDKPIRVVGGTSDCACVTTDDLPITIPPKARRSLKVRVKFRGGPGAFNREAWLWTDLEEQRMVHFGLTGRIVPPAAELAGTNRK